ncbi:AAA family ATPase [Chitinophaga vietnamensis]|uniref:AAA family ATPase n=1 Tax=Chitinophaga vietnamensis TaxID=2593957 RepID=UPI00117892DC|nr:AAA family ATPase [Chitinophaga vietnamensis]
MNTFYVITGGPGAGKSTLLAELERRQYKCMPEDARRIIREEVAAGSNALPWKDRQQFLQRMLQAGIHTYEQAAALPPQVIFFDRGIPDALCYAQLTGAAVEDYYAQKYRYHRKVFLLPPWRAIYTTDTERKQSWEEAVQTYQLMVHTYQHYGYDTIEIPFGSVEARAAFLLAQL